MVAGGTGIRALSAVFVSEYALDLKNAEAWQAGGGLRHVQQDRLTELKQVRSMCIPVKE